MTSVFIFAAIGVSVTGGYVMLLISGNVPIPFRRKQMEIVHDSAGTSTNNLPPMRPIKYMGFRNGVLHQVDFMRTDDRFKFDFNIFWLPDDKPLAQFTGLLDKKNKELYEGHLVTDAERTYRIAFGEWNMEEYSFLGWILVSTKSGSFGLSVDDAKYLTIIGHVYTHPEINY